MAVGYDVIVRSVGDVWKDSLFVVVVTKNGINLHDKDGNVITRVLYPHLRLKVLKILEHKPFIRIYSGNSYQTLEYESLSDAKDAYRLFRLAIKNSKNSYAEQSSRILPVDSTVVDRDVNETIFRTRLHLKADNIDIIFIPLEQVCVIEDWAYEKINETFYEVVW